MAAPEPESVLRRYREAKTRRGQWEALWQECGDFALPSSGSVGRAFSPGQRRTDRIFDGTAPDAVEQLAASLLSELTPPWSRWFGLAAGPAVSEAERSTLEPRLETAESVVQAHFDQSNFAVEMLLQPVDLRDSRLDPDKLRLYDAELIYREGNRQAQLSLLDRPLASASAWWDPAYGAPGKGDASVVAAVFSDTEGRRYLHRIAYLQHDPARIAEVDEATQLCRQVAGFLKDNYLPAVTIETNGVGRFLPSLLRRELAAAEVPAAVIETVSRRPKAERIVEAFDALLAAGALFAHRQVWSTPFILEMREWRPDKAAQARDDGLDAVSGCLLSEPVRLPRKPYAGRQTWRGDSHRALPGAFDI